jgi:twinkle protein
MISQTTIEAIKQRINITELIGDFVKLKKEGANYVGLCPFHDEKSGSFTVSHSKNMFKCFGCGKSGDGINFIMEHNKLGYVDAIKLLATKYNIEIIEVEYEETKRTYTAPAPRLEKISKRFIEWFENRGISNNTLLRFKVTECLEWMPKARKETTTLCFNYYEQDNLVNIKFRAANKDFKLSKDARLIFYNLDAISGLNEAIISEGEIDAMSWHEVEEYAVVSVPNGAGTGNLKLEYLDNCYSYFEGKTKIYISTDNDEAGRRLCEELCRRLGKERCYIIEYPKDCKDANDVLVKHGKETLRKLKQDAKLYPLDGESTIESMKPILYDFYENGYPKGCESGLIDDSGANEGFLTFIPQQLTMVTGINGHGKDEIVNAICVGLAKGSGWKTAICQFEENPEITASKIIEKFVGKAFDFRKDATKRMNKQEFEQGLLFVDEYFKVMNVNEMGTSIDEILEKARQMIFRYGINVLVISPWNCIEHQIPNGMAETNYISLTLSKITRFIKKFNIHCFLIAHPTKMQKNLQTKKYEVPTLQNISGSVHFANKAHNGLSVYRNFDDFTTEVHIQKAKFYWLGRIGMRLFYYDSKVRQYVSQYATTPENKPVMPPPNFKKIDIPPNLEEGHLFIDEDLQEQPF